jgi:CelD/BcsL family acetyltransferase involved in cellulose biosynthesis
MLRIVERNDFSSLATLRADWRRLLSQTPGATFFHSLDWLEAYWRHYGAAQRLRVLVAEEDSTVVGIVPLTVLREPSSLGPLRVLTYPQAYWGSHYGPIGPDPAGSLRAAVDHVRRTRRDWDLFDLRFAPAVERDPARSVEAMTVAGFAPQTKASEATSLIDLPTTYSDYLATRTPKWRNNVRRWERRLAEQGTVQFVRYRPQGSAAGDDHPRWDLYEHCEQVASRSWQGSATDGTTITHASVQPFLREAHEAACRAGTADMSLLYVDDRPTAFLYAYAYGGRVDGLRTGYDPTGPHAGVGNLLYMRVIEDSIARGDHTIDLGPNYAAAKRPFVTRVDPVLRHGWGNPRSWRGLLWHAKRAYDARFPRVDRGLSPSCAKGDAEAEDLNGPREQSSLQPLSLGT